MDNCWKALLQKDYWVERRFGMKAVFFAGWYRGYINHLGSCTIPGSFGYQSTIILNLQCQSLSPSSIRRYCIPTIFHFCYLSSCIDTAFSWSSFSMLLFPFHRCRALTKTKWTSIDIHNIESTIARRIPWVWRNRYIWLTSRVLNGWEGAPALLEPISKMTTNF